MKKIASYLSSQQRKIVKRYIRKFKSFIQFWVKPMTLERMESILREDMGIKEGDRIFVTSAFGSLKAAFSPKELVELLMKVVGKNGIIMMPYYPPGSSTEWAESGAVFDMEQTKSSMGVMTNVFSRMHGVVKSNHPTKAVCVWGKDAERIAANHAQCKSPFGTDSPYGKLLQLHSKSIGIATGKCPMGHCCEDILNPSLNHYQEPIKLGVRENGEIEFYPTLIHDMSKLFVAPVEFIKGSPDYKKVKTGYEYSYVIDNDKVYAFYKQDFAAGRGSLK